ncbi:MAG TPA: RHS repeat-associated core domain-containing protein, partial [Noviherbaspirillum sp.]|nr:RHS repeat-associated core domain-containing protein [Noviherbaspirillum sp.]
YAGAQEVESVGGQTTVKTYWPQGVGVEIDRPNQAPELSWLHTDRLGSVIALTDANGNLREKLAYDAWGKRRTLDGSAIPDSLDGQVDNRGYTGHEMLDRLDLVHMNGRVYDPFVARFLSADPIIQDPSNGQNYSRYSYVFNNPTNLTDPTGFTTTAAHTVTMTAGYISWAYDSTYQRPTGRELARRSLNQLRRFEMAARPWLLRVSVVLAAVTTGGNAYQKDPHDEQMAAIKAQAMAMAAAMAEAGADKEDASEALSNDAEGTNSGGGAKEGKKDGAKPGREKDVPNRGEPGEVREGERRTREYGPDGKPIRDYDKPHQGYERPHVHEWPDGVREHPGRDYSPWPRQ